MPKRVEDPTLLGVVIAFDPEEESRRYEEEQEQKRLAKKKKKNDSSICSGATESTSKSESNNSNGPVPEKIVTHIVREESSPGELETGQVAIPTPPTATPTPACPTEQKEEREVPSEPISKEKKDKSRKKTARKSESKDKKKEKADKNAKKQAKKDAKKAKKEDRRRKRAACHIQRIARGYLVRRELETRALEEQKVIQDTSEGTDATPRAPGRFARIRQALSRAPREHAAASRLQRVFRLLNLRKLFRRGERERWRKALHRLFLPFLLQSSTNQTNQEKQNKQQQQEQLKKAQLLLENGAHPDNDSKKKEQNEDDKSDDSSSTGSAEPDMEILPLHHDSPVKSLVEPRPTTTADLLDVIPEDRTHCEIVGRLLPGLDDSESSLVSDELMVDVLHESLPKLRRLDPAQTSKGHASCSSLRLDCV